MALIYECDHCGLCCEDLIIEVEHADVLREPRIAERFKLLDGNGKLPMAEAQWGLNVLKPSGYGCPFHQSNRCEIHATRPHVCVAFLAGSKKCLELREGMKLPPLQAVERDDVVARVLEMGLNNGEE